MVGLLVDRHGFPLEIGCFEGNKAEKLTILPVIRQFQARHGIEAMVVVADAGMLSAANLDDLDEAGLGFIVGSRVTKAPVDLESHFRWHGDAFSDGQVIDTVTPKTGQEQGQRPRPAGRARLGPRGPPEVLAGGLGVLREAVRARQPDPHRAGEPRPRRHQRREVRPHAPVRQERGREPRPWTRRPSPARGSWPG